MPLCCVVKSAECVRCKRRKEGAEAEKFIAVPIEGVPTMLIQISLHRPKDSTA
jgi:hypothetical protein